MSTDIKAAVWDTLTLGMSMLPTPGLLAAVSVASFQVPSGLRTLKKPELCSELTQRVRVAFATWLPVVPAGSGSMSNFNQGLSLLLKPIVAAPPQSTVVDFVEV